MDQTQQLSINQLSVEHILPQNPADDSQWKRDFTDAEREAWTHKLGNLVLITSRKNTAQGRKDFTEKKESYFKNRINTCPNSLYVLNNHTRWTPEELKAHHAEVIEKLKAHYAG